MQWGGVSVSEFNFPIAQLLIVKMPFQHHFSFFSGCLPCLLRSLSFLLSLSLSNHQFFLSPSLIRPASPLLFHIFIFPPSLTPSLPVYLSSCHSLSLFLIPPPLPLLLSLPWFLLSVALDGPWACQTSVDAVCFACDSSNEDEAVCKDDSGDTR